MEKGEEIELEKVKPEVSNRGRGRKKERVRKVYVINSKRKKHGKLKRQIEMELLISQLKQTKAEADYSRIELEHSRRHDKMFKASFKLAKKRRLTYIS